jgi:hypothetical protein
MPIPERDPLARQFTTHGILLNLVSAHGHTNKPELQPFATTELTLHSEGSGRPLGEQPRYIVLTCCDPGDATTQAQTILASMEGVAARLDLKTSALLSNLRYQNRTAVPAILRSRNGQAVFSFRDFKGAALNWAYSGDATIGAVNRAILSLLAAMYESESFGVEWAEGLTLIIDNTRFFHGRTAGAAVPSAHQRHLKRLRLA